MIVELTVWSLYGGTRGARQGRHGWVRAFNAPEAESLCPGNLRSCSFFLPGRKKLRYLYAKVPSAVAEGHVKVKSIRQLSQPGQCPLSPSGSQRNAQGQELAVCLGTARPAGTGRSLQHASRAKAVDFSAFSTVSIVLSVTPFIHLLIHLTQSV